MSIKYVHFFEETLINQSRKKGTDNAKPGLPVVVQIGVNQQCYSFFARAKSFFLQCVFVRTARS